MYRALAGQLRLLLCDEQRKVDKSLLAAVYPRLEVSAIKSIGWSQCQAGDLRLIQSHPAENRIAQMPIDVTIYANGLSVADLLVVRDRVVPIAKWAEQHLTFHPETLSIRTVIRTVADKGGGAHVDAKASRELRKMYEHSPFGRTYAELFVLAIGRYIQEVREQLFNVKGCRVPEELTSQAYQKCNLLLVAPVDAIPD